MPCDYGNGLTSGGRLGPAAIRRASLSLGNPAQGVDRGDIALAQECDWEVYLAQVEAALHSIFEGGSKAMLLGGDHAISYAAVAATRPLGKVNVVWFDAHTDFCAWDRKEWHDHKQVLRRIADLEHVARIVQVGHRGITYYDEVGSLDRVAVITAAQAREFGAAAILKHLPMGEQIYVSIDIDVLDPVEAPGTGHPVPGGFSVAQLCKLVAHVVNARRVVGIDMMEVNPLLDHADATSIAAATILATVAPLLLRADD